MKLSRDGSRLTLCDLTRNLQKWFGPLSETIISTSLQAARRFRDEDHT